MQDVDGVINPLKLGLWQCGKDHIAQGARIHVVGPDSVKNELQ